MGQISVPLHAKDDSGQPLVLFPSKPCQVPELTLLTRTFRHFFSGDVHALSLCHNCQFVNRCHVQDDFQEISMKAILSQH